MKTDILKGAVLENKWGYKGKNSYMKQEPMQQFVNEMMMASSVTLDDEKDNVWIPKV